MMMLVKKPTAPKKEENKRSKRSEKRSMQQETNASHIEDSTELFTVSCLQKNAGAIRDTVAGELELARYFLAILSLADEYKPWRKLSGMQTAEGALTNEGTSTLNARRKRQYPTDHTQVHSNNVQEFGLRQGICEALYCYRLILMIVKCRISL